MKSNKFFDNVQNTKLDFVKNFFKFGAVSLVIILVGMIVWITAGFNLGLDFTGGTIVKVKFGQVLEEQGRYETYTAQINEIFNKYGIAISQTQKEDSNEEASISVRFKDPANLSEAELSALIAGDITDELTATFNPDDSNADFAVYESQRIGATASGELIAKSLIAIIIAAVLLLIYIAIRFQFASGVATLIAIIHDVLVVCALMAIFRIEINAAFIAALITVIGYSINNTIITFDRVRENERNENVMKLGTAHLVNLSIKQTLVRSIYTSLTTLISIIALVILGVTSIKIFLIPIIIGLIAGTYSSIFIAAPLWQIMIRRLLERKKIEGELKRHKPNAKATTAIDSTNNSVEVEVIEN